LVYRAGVYDSATVRDMLKECSKMSKFDHPNVVTLIGVCLDGGPAPFIIMPFMTNGSLLAYLTKNRPALVIESSNSQDNNEVFNTKNCSSACRYEIVSCRRMFVSG
jgi:serine/threonine protein kinase